MRKPWRAGATLAVMAGLSACVKPPLTANWRYLAALDEAPARYVPPTDEGTPAPPAAQEHEKDAGRRASMFVVLTNTGKKPIALSAVYLNDLEQPAATWGSVRLEPGVPYRLDIASAGEIPRCLVPRRLIVERPKRKPHTIAIEGRLSGSMQRAYLQQGCAVTP